MIGKLKSGAFRRYCRETDPKTGKRRNLGTLRRRHAAEREVQYCQRSGG